MPVYEYYCPKCKSNFEKLLPIGKAEAAITCTQCNNPSQRVLSRFASFSKNSTGETTAIAGAGNSCSGCSSTSCSSCH